MKRTHVALLLGALLSFGIAAQTAQPAGLTGTWQIEYRDKSAKEVSMSTVSLVQSGGRLEGGYGAQRWKVQGTVAGDQVQFSFSPPNIPGLTVRFQATLDAPGRMHGTMVSEAQSGTFVATRKK